MIYTGTVMKMNGLCCIKNLFVFVWCLAAVSVNQVNCKLTYEDFGHRNVGKKAIPPPRLTLNLDKAPCDR